MNSLNTDILTEVIPFVALKDLKALSRSTRAFAQLEEMMEAIFIREMLERGGKKMHDFIKPFPKKYLNFSWKEKEALLTQHSVIAGMSEDGLTICFALHRSPSLIASLYSPTDPSFAKNTLFQRDSYSSWSSSRENITSSFETDFSIHDILQNQGDDLYHRGYTREWKVRDAVIEVIPSRRAAAIIQLYTIDPVEEEVCPKCLQEGYFTSDVYQLEDKIK